MRLLTLILISIFVNWSFQSTQKCDSDLQLLGQIQKATFGVDITKLDLLSMNDDGVRSVLFELTCNQSQLWTNQNLPDSSYQIPDQVLEALIKVPASIHKSVTIYQDFSDFKEIQQNNFIVTNDSLHAVSSQSGTYRLLQSNILNNFTVVEILVKISAYSVSLNDFKSDSKIDNFVEELPSKYDSPYEQNRRNWQELISEFGTHYFQNADFGGALLLRSFIGNDKINEKTIPAISTYLLGKYNKLIGRKLSVDESRKLDFHISTSLSSYGGMDIRKQFGTDVLKDYALSVLREPVIVSGKLKSITNIIQNKTIGQQVKVAIEATQKQALLEELITLLHTIKLSFHPVMDKITNLTFEKNPDESQVIAVKSEVDILLSQFLSKISSPSPNLLKQLKEMLERGVV